MTIRINQRALTDGSHVTDLILSGEGPKDGEIYLPTIGGRAYKCAELLKKVIEFNTTETVLILEE